MTAAETNTAAEPSPAAETKSDSLAASRVLLKDLQAGFDVFRSFVPLAIGIDKQYLALHPDADRKALRHALRSHTLSTRYLKEMQTATQRRNLDGSEAGVVTDEARTHAAEQLRERFKKQADARRAVEAATKAAEAEARAEARRHEKLGQLAEKFGRKAR
jgi:ProP effector